LFILYFSEKRYRENIFLKKYENREKICGKERERNIAG